MSKTNVDFHMSTAQFIKYLHKHKRTKAQLIHRIKYYRKANDDDIEL